MRSIASSLRPLALVCHGALLLSVCALLLRSLTVSPAREIAIAIAVAPLLATAPGLARGHRAAEQWLALVLVAYAGGAVVEVVASAGGAVFGNVALLTSLFELGLVLALIRRPPHAPSRAHERTES